MEIAGAHKKETVILGTAAAIGLGAIAVVVASKRGRQFVGEILDPLGQIEQSGETPDPSDS